MTPNTLPDARFHTRVRNPALDGPNPFEWKTVSTAEVFGGKRVVLFGVPGAFTPACSDTHLPGYERQMAAFRDLGIDKVICTSVNDAFVMHRWAVALNVSEVKMLPDGNGTFARRMGMLVDRSAQGMGLRSWRYSLFAEDGNVRQLFAEPGIRDNPEGVPVQVSDADTMLGFLRSLPG